MRALVIRVRASRDWPCTGYREQNAKLVGLENTHHSDPRLELRVGLDESLSLIPYGTTTQRLGTVSICNNIISNWNF